MQWSYSDQDRISGATLEGDWNGAVFRGMQKLEVSDEVSRDPMYGNDSIAIGMPVGSVKGEITFETIPEEADEVLNALGPEFYKIPGTVGFSCMRANGLYLVQLTRVYLNKQQITFEGGGQKGSTGTLTGIILDPIDWNGLRGVESKAVQGFGFPISLGF